MIEFRNDSKLIFKDISSELFREYIYADGTTVLIDSPRQLNVSPNGHRIFTEDEDCHYIPKGWRRIHWRVREGAAHFSL